MTRNKKPSNKKLEKSECKFNVGCSRIGIPMFYCIKHKPKIIGNFETLQGKCQDALIEFLKDRNGIKL